MDESLSTAASLIAQDYPGRRDFIALMITLLTSSTPPFLYLYDPITMTISASILKDILLRLTQDIPPQKVAHHVIIDCIELHTPRLVFDAILNTLSQWKPTWDSGCTLWNGGSLDGLACNDSFDSFMHGLRLACAHLTAEKSSSSNAKTPPSPVKIVLVFENAERLNLTMPNLIVPWTRLAELVQHDVITVFMSEMSWDDACPAPGAYLDPFRIVVDPLRKSDAIATICNDFPGNDDLSAVNPYNPLLRTLFGHFVEVVYDICSPFTTDIREISYIVAARWPGFVTPVLEDWKAQDAETGMKGVYSAPTEDARMRLTRLFTSSIASAVDVLYPRRMSATDWMAVSGPAEGFRLSQSLGQSLPTGRSGRADDQSAELSLPEISNYILVASFLASSNPPKSDLRLFARMADEKRRRKKGGGARNNKVAATSKIPQRFLGPTTFPLDRLIAIAGALLEEHDADNLPSVSQGASATERIEIETNRVDVLGSVQELISMQLLHRTTSSDKIDGPPMLRCAISHETAAAIARKLDITLGDLTWEQ